MSKLILPKITFGIIVLNGEPFTSYCLRSIYPFAHEIIVVEGGHEDAKSVCTPDGHSIDGTLESLKRFKEDNDPDNKVVLVLKDNFWPKKDEMGNDRTPQSRAYAEKATGDYLWQIDIDEFYREQDIKAIIEILAKNPEVTAISFQQRSFWGSINYLSDSCYLRSHKSGWNRVFKWNSGYKYLTHEPPTVLDEKGIDLHTVQWITGDKLAKKGIYMYHYSLLFPSQVEQKVKLYKEEKPDVCKDIILWAEDNYFKLSKPYRVHNVYNSPSWLLRFTGEHPKEIINMINDINSNLIFVEQRETKDIEKLLSHWWYPFGIKIILTYNFFLKIFKLMKTPLSIAKRFVLRLWLSGL